MEIVDYYAALNVSRRASAEEIKKAFETYLNNAPEPSRFNLVVAAYETLSNRYKRARYDKTLGFLMVIQIDEKPYPNASCYLINHPQPFFALQQTVIIFKEWIFKKYELDWSEAQSVNYAYSLVTFSFTEPYLLLSFPRKLDKDLFAQYLLSEKRIKPVEDKL